MFISETGLNLIKQFEGCRLTAYRDIAGVLTIGYGHTGDVHEGQTISKQQADDMLRQDILKYSNEVQKLMDNKTILFEVNQNMFDALTSFCYNLGQGNLRRLVQARSKEQVAEHMMLYVNANHKVVKGLVNRRTKERELFLKPVEQPVKTTINVYVVKRGDNLTKIAKRLNTTIKHLAEINDIHDINKIFIGQVLRF